MLRKSWNLLFVLLLGSSFPLTADVLYNVTELSTFLANPNNGAGPIAAASSGYASQVLLYTNGQVINVGGLPGYIYNQPMAVNSKGQVLGLSIRDPLSGGSEAHSFLYSNGVITDLGNIIARDINDAGQITGDAPTSSGAQHAFIYQNGQMTDLGILPGYVYSSSVCINNSGQAVGRLTSSSGSIDGFLYSNGQMIDLGAFVPIDMNDVGQVVGQIRGQVGTNAALYQGGQITNLGVLPGSNYSEVFGINNAGQVVGYSGNLASFDEHPFLYSNGQMVNLNELIDPKLGITLERASAINDLGQITANSNLHTYILTPVPEPSTLLLFGVPFLGLLVRARRAQRRNRES